MAAKIQFQAAQVENNLLARSANREGLGLVARRDLARYYECLDRELQEIKLTEDETRVICDYLHRFLSMQPEDPTAGLGLLLALVLFDDEDLCRERSVDMRTLNEKIRALTWTQRQALVDAVERYWLNPTGTDAFRRAGLMLKSGASSVAQRREQNAEGLRASAAARGAARLSR